MRKKAWAAGSVGLAALYLLTAGDPAGTPVADPVRDELDARLAACSKRFALKTVVYDSLIAGRLTLAQAVAECEAIERKFPDVGGSFRRGLDALVPGRTYEEQVAWSVVRSCEAILMDHPAPDAVLARLHSQLRAFASSNG